MTSQESQKPDLDRVTAEQARAVQVNPPEVTKLEKDDAANFAQQMAMQQAERGVINKLIGSRAEKSGNIAFIVVLLGFATAILGHFLTTPDSKLETGSLGLITLALGYIFGSGNKQ